jgi:hypothetical protein
VCAVGREVHACGGRGGAGGVARGPDVYWVGAGVLEECGVGDGDEVVKCRRLHDGRSGGLGWVSLWWWCGVLEVR